MNEDSEEESDDIGGTNTAEDSASGESQDEASEESDDSGGSESEEHKSATLSELHAKLANVPFGKLAALNARQKVVELCFFPIKLLP